MSTRWLNCYRETNILGIFWLHGFIPNVIISLVVSCCQVYWGLILQQNLQMDLLTYEKHGSSFLGEWIHILTKREDHSDIIKIIAYKTRGTKYVRTSICSSCHLARVVFFLYSLLFINGKLPHWCIILLLQRKINVTVRGLCIGQVLGKLHSYVGRKL